jgi:hypothetical protein
MYHSQLKWGSLFFLYGNPQAYVNKTYDDVGENGEWDPYNEAPFFKK